MPESIRIKLPAELTAATPRLDAPRSPYRPAVTAQGLKPTAYRSRRSAVVPRRAAY